MKWTTEFNTYEQTMTQVLSDQVRVITDFRNNTVSLIKEGKKIDSHDIDNFSVTDYTDYVIRNYIDAQKLQELHNSLQEVQG
jgi:hypothetical protein